MSMRSVVQTAWLSLDDLRHKSVSYAQNFEDVLLRRAFGDATGLYIDVGANHPVFHSVTKAFYDRGWRGVNIEPQPALHRLLCAERIRDVNLNVGLSDCEGNRTLYEVPDYRHGWSTFHPEAAESYRRQGVAVVERSIPVTTLARVCAEHVQQSIDFLKIDAECYELQVLRGADWDRWRPRVVLIEAGVPLLVAQWEPVMREAHYELAAFDGINRYYVRAEESELLPAFAAPVNVLDNAVAYDYVRIIEELHALGELSPTERALLQRVRAFARLHPRLRSLARRLLRPTG